jgi:hypothetical protein
MLPRAVHGYLARRAHRPLGECLGELTLVGLAEQRAEVLGELVSR